MFIHLDGDIYSWSKLLPKTPQPFSSHLEFHCKTEQQSKTGTRLSSGTLKDRDIFPPGLFFRNELKVHVLNSTFSELSSWKKTVQATESDSVIQWFLVQQFTCHMQHHAKLCPHQQFKTTALRKISHYLWPPLWLQETSVFVLFHKVQSTQFQIDLNNKAMLVNCCVSDEDAWFYLELRYIQRSYNFLWGAEHTMYLVHASFLWLPEQTQDWGSMLEFPAKYQSSFLSIIYFSSVPCIFNSNLLVMCFIWQQAKIQQVCQCLSCSPSHHTAKQGICWQE